MKCPVCKSGHSSFWASIDRFEKIFRVRKCSECLSLFQSPLPKSPDLYYDKDYYSGQAGYSYHDERDSYAAKAIVYRARSRNIRRFIPGGRSLDVGCSFGGFSRALSEHFEAYGIDVSDFAVNSGNQWLKEAEVDKKVKLVHGSLVKNNLKRETFNLVTLIEVAEHLDDPASHFKAAFELLQPGGLLVIQTANFDGWQAIKAGRGYHYFMPGHLVYYTASGLKKLLSDIGFTEFLEFIPVDFSLFAKLRKSAKSISSMGAFFRLFRTAWYHVVSFLKKQGRPLTSSYVLYAFK